LVDPKVVHKPFSAEGEERYTILIPPQSRDGKAIDVPHVPRTVLWDKYVGFLTKQVKAFFKLILCFAGIIIVMPIPGINFLAVVLSVAVGFFIKEIVVNQELKTINFSRHNIPYPFFEG